jgi:hypothetical protein
MARASSNGYWRAVGRQNGVKLAASASFIMLTLALILIAINSPAHGYELSLYGSLPAATWGLIAVAMIIGTGIIVSEALSSDKSRQWYLGFLIIFLCDVIIMSLPIVRGYVAVAISDPIGQIGVIQGVVTNSLTGTFNYYPVTTLVGASLAELSSVSPATAAILVPIFFSLLSIVFVYLLASQVSCNRRHALLAAAAGTTLLYSYYQVSAYPQAEALFLFPLAFYLYFKVLRTGALAFKVSFIILVVLLPFTHPSVEVVFIICLFGVGILLWVLEARGANGTVETLRKSTLNLALASALLFVAWFSAFSAFGGTSLRFFNWLRGNVAAVPRSSEFAAGGSLPLQEQVSVAFKTYGDQFIFLALAAVALIIIARQYLKHRSDAGYPLVFAALVVISGPVFVLLFLGSGTVTLGRFVGANTVLWALPVLAAFTLARLGDVRRLSRPIAVGIITLVLVSTAIIGVFSVYRSSWIDQPNTQVTQMQYDGTGWSSAYANDTASFGYLGISAGYHYAPIPAHFGHPGNSTLGSALQQTNQTGVLLLVTEEFRQAAKDPILSAGSLSPQGLSAQGFTTDDLSRLQRDVTVNKVSENGEFEVFQVV